MVAEAICPKVRSNGKKMYWCRVTAALSETLRNDATAMRV
jgi:hypothetical protein